MNLHLVDNNPEVVEALRARFARYPEVEVLEGNIVEVGQGAVVSPANSYGFMDGGVDKAYARFFGSLLARAVRDAVLARPEGHLPVGAALAVATGHARIKYLIVAPTMMMPEHVPAANAYRALRAALKLVSSNPDLGSHLYSPGLATLVGGVPPDAAAAEMAEAYGDWRAG